MFEDDKIYSNLKKYQELLQENNKIIEKINTTVKESEKIKTYYKELELNKSREIQLTQDKIKQFVKEKNFVEIKKTLQKVETLKKDLNFSKKLMQNVNKINLVANKNSILNKQIEDRLTAMGLREAQAKSFIEKKIAQAKNFIDDKIVKYKMSERNRVAENLNNLKAKNNDFNKTQQMENLKTNPILDKLSEIEKKSMIRKEQIAQARAALKDGGLRNKGNLNRPLDIKEMQKNYEVIKRDNFTLYKNKENPNIKIKDYGDRLTCDSNNPESIRKMIEIAEKKGWNLDKVKIQGDKKFQEAIKKQIAERKKEYINIENYKLTPIDVNINDKDKAKSNFDKLSAAKEKIEANQKLKYNTKTTALNTQKQELPKQERSFTR